MTAPRFTGLKAFLIASGAGAGAISASDAFPQPWRAWAGVYAASSGPLLAYLLRGPGGDLTATPPVEPDGRPS